MTLAVFAVAHPTDIVVASLALISPMSEPSCPPCELLFGDFDQPSRSTGSSRQVTMVERGEPKSGTGFMFDWAANSLSHACEYLKAVFGENSCTQTDLRDHNLHIKASSTLKFQPEKVTDGTVCTCEKIEK